MNYVVEVEREDGEGSPYYLGHSGQGVGAGGRWVRNWIDEAKRFGRPSDARNEAIAAGSPEPGVFRARVLMDEPGRSSSVGSFTLGQP